VVKTDGWRLRFDKVDKTGVVTLRYRGRLHHIGIGAAYKGRRIAMLIDGRKIEIVGLDGSPLRRIVLDPSRDYQPQVSSGVIPVLRCLATSLSDVLRHHRAEGLRQLSNPPKEFRQLCEQEKQQPGHQQTRPRKR